MSADHDLSGDWLGSYSYPHSYPPVRFQALLHDAGGAISGETVEVDEIFAPGTTLRALVDGRRDGAAVTFAKVYENEEFNSEIVRYQGTVAPGGDEISGTWEVPGIWAGSFLMVREGGAEEEIERRAVATIESP